jgi:hypothetical protein
MAIFAAVGCIFPVAGGVILLRAGN